MKILNKENLLKKYIFLFATKVLGQFFKFLLVIYLSSSLLSIEEFGEFSLYLAILNISYLIAGLGVIDSTMYLLNQTDIDTKGQIGASLVLLIIVMGIFSGIMYLILSYFSYDHLIILSFLSIGYVFQIFVKKIAIPLLDYFVLYYFDLILYGTTFFVIVIFGKTLEEIILLYSGISILLSSLFLFKNGFTFENINENIKICISTVYYYGFKIHLSQIISMISYDSDKFILEHNKGLEAVGIYNLGLNLIMPVKLFSTSISELLFKDFGNKEKIPQKVLIINGLVSIILGVIVSIIGYIIIVNFYDESYLILLDFIFLLPLLAFLHSFYTPINFFFTAKGLAKEKLINAIFLGVSSLFFNFLLIPFYGVKGAFLASIAALILNNIVFLFQYVAFIKKVGHNVKKFY